MTYTLFQGHCDVKMKTVFACSDQLEFRLCMLHAQTWSCTTCCSWVWCVTGDKFSNSFDSIDLFVLGYSDIGKIQEEVRFFSSKFLSSNSLKLISCYCAWTRSCTICFASLWHVFKGDSWHIYSLGKNLKSLPLLRCCLSEISETLHDDNLHGALCVQPVLMTLIHVQCRRR